MIFNETEFTLKDGRVALLRSPHEDDAEEMLQFIIKASGETDFLMKFPEEYADFTLEQEKDFLTGAYQSENAMMIACVVDGRIAGTCQIPFTPGRKIATEHLLRSRFCRSFGALGSGLKCSKRCSESPENAAESGRSSLILSKATAGQDSCMRIWASELQA